MALGMGASAYRSHPLDKWRVTRLRDHREVDAVRLGLAIRAFRRRQHWTQRQLGDRCDMSSSEISRLERGGARTRTLGSSERVLEALKSDRNQPPGGRNEDAASLDARGVSGFGLQRPER
jgi:Helix-turn-helix domain